MYQVHILDDCKRYLGNLWEKVNYVHGAASSILTTLSPDESLQLPSIMIWFHVISQMKSTFHYTNRISSDWISIFMKIKKDLLCHWASTLLWSFLFKPKLHKRKGYLHISKNLMCFITLDTRRTILLVLSIN